MKKRILLFTAIAGMASAMLISGKNGAGAEKGYDCTGAETGLGNFAGCGGASGCHNTSATTGIGIALELDSAGIATTHYTGGMTYTVKITGTNNTTATLPAFGFQVSCVKGSTAAVTPVNEGTFASTGLPANVRYTPAQNTPPNTYFACNVVEHSNPIAATTLGGATGGIYAESFQWTAPIAGTGTISFWGVVNAVDDDGYADAGDVWNTKHIAISEWPAVNVVGNVSDNISIKAYPNPVSTNLNLQLDNAQEGVYSLRVSDISGRIVTDENINVAGTSHTASINTGNWAAGTYHVALHKDGFTKTISVVKK